VQDASNRWRPFKNEKGELWKLTNDLLARKNPDGSPDYTDPDVFPVMWTADERVPVAS